MENNNSYVNARREISLREGNTIFDVLNIPIETSKEDVMSSALSFYESGRVITREEWDTVSNDLSLLGVDWAPKPITYLNVKSNNSSKMLNFSIVRSVFSRSKIYRK